MQLQNLRRHDEFRKEWKRSTVQLLGETDRVNWGRLVCSDLEDETKDVLSNVN